MTQKNAYTGIIRLKDKITHNGYKYRIIIISEIKPIGSKKDKHDLIWVRDTPGFKYLHTGDVIKFNTRASEQYNLKYLTKSNKFDIEELKKIPHFVNITDIIHLKDETNNGRIKIRSCLKCGATIYYKEKGIICQGCRRYMNKIKHTKNIRAERRQQKKIDEKNKTKTCRACGKTYLKVTHFINSKRSKDGYAQKCIYCRNKRV